MSDQRVHEPRACRVDEGLVAELAEVLGISEPPRPGDALPPLWHWAALSSWAPLAELRVDGHPAARPLPGYEEFGRRMFGGGRVRFLQTITVGEPVTIAESASPPRLKRGKSGEFVLVTVRRSVRTPEGAACIEEEQDLVYRPIVAPPASSDADRSPAVTLPLMGAALTRTQGGAVWELRTDPVVLMRFSALTRNAHRIHFDGNYSASEGYAAPVVHGPLQAIALAEVHRRSCPGMTVRRVSHRGSSPLLCGVDATIRRVDGSTTYALEDKRSGVTFSTLEVEGDHDARRSHL